MLLKHLEFESDERIIATLHKHWFVFASLALGQFVVAIIPTIMLVILLLAMGSFVPNAQIDIGTYGRYFIFLQVCWFLYVWMVFAYRFTVQYLDVWIITDRRIITVDQEAFFRRHIASFRLERLQDITIDIDGMLATFLDYGTLEAQTASESGEEFRVRYMPHPEAIKATIRKAADARIAQYRDTTGDAL